MLIHRTMTPISGRETFALSEEERIARSSLPDVAVVSRAAIREKYAKKMLASWEANEGCTAKAEHALPTSPEAKSPRLDNYIGIHLCALRRPTQHRLCNSRIGLKRLAKAALML
jgi:hypothetical protein